MKPTVNSTHKFGKKHKMDGESQVEICSDRHVAWINAEMYTVFVKLFIQYSEMVNKAIYLRLNNLLSRKCYLLPVCLPIFNNSNSKLMKVLPGEEKTLNSAHNSVLLSRSLHLPQLQGYFLNDH